MAQNKTKYFKHEEIKNNISFVWRDRYLAVL